MRNLRVGSRLLVKASLLSLCVALGGACDGGGSAAPKTGAGGTSGGAAGSAATVTGAAGTSSAGDAGTSAAGTSGAAGTSDGQGGSAAGGTRGAAGAGATPDAGADAGGGSGSIAGATGHAGATAAAGTAGAAGTGAAGTSGAAGTGSSSTFPARIAAPYVETWSNHSLTDLATATGNKYYTLAFMLGKGCAAAWNGDTPINSETYYGTQIANLRKAGGDVIISFGGADGTELGDVCTTVESLQAAYQAVITKYDLKWMDLDIESGAESKATDIDRRNKALKNLQAANPGLKVSYTLAVDPSGLPQAQRALLANAQTNGVHVDTVNVMAMDYGDCNLDMGAAAISAAEGTRAQIQKLGSGSSVGVTPMIGVNDTACENFTTANATALVTYAQANDYINLLAFWAVGADANHAYLKIFTMLH